MASNPNPAMLRFLLAASVVASCLAARLPAADTTVYPDQSKALLEADSRVAYDSISGMAHSSFLEHPFQALVISNHLESFLSAHLLK